MNKAVFLDRDGVINQSKIINGEAFSPSHLGEFVIIAGVKEAIIDFKQKGYIVIVVTNQPEVARGTLKLSELEKMHDYLKSELAVDDIMMCPHDNQHGCECRKPKPGMILTAAKKWDVDLKNSILVGDRWKDIEAGQSAGCKTVLIDNPAKGRCVPDITIKKLSDLICQISAS